MLTSCYPPLDSTTFSNPVTAHPPISDSPSALTQQKVFQLPQGQTWLLDFTLGTQGDLLRTSLRHPKDLLSKKAEEIKPPVAKLAMNVIEPEDDLNSLINNDRKLRLCGYYYGSLSWVDVSHLLGKCKVGTFLVRDSEHFSYLYTLSVQTRKGPTSCRIEYVDGRFRLDAAKNLLHKMPLFDCVTNLIDYYVQLQRHWPHRKLSPVWLDMDEENSMDVPVQIYKPLYKRVHSLQHMCRLNIVKRIKERYSLKAPLRTMENPSAVISRTVEEDSQYSVLPNIIKNYLAQYPYSQ